MPKKLNMFSTITQFEKPGRVAGSIVISRKDLTKASFITQERKCLIKKQVFSEEGHSWEYPPIGTT